MAHVQAILTLITTVCDSCTCDTAAFRKCHCAFPFQYHVTYVIMSSRIRVINMGKRNILDATLHIKDHTQENKNRA